MSTDMPDDELVGWVTLAEAKYGHGWSDAATTDEAHLVDLLDAAYQQCAAFAGMSPSQAPESRHRIAQVMQARALYRANLSGDNNGMGPEGFTITIWPMDWTVKNLLRPKRAVPVMF